jgi:AraC-like DNA-binding protein
MKMREASRLLSRPGSTVKETALTLGYRHPGDFTRAYAKFHGHPPSDRDRAPMHKGQIGKRADRED